MSIELALEDRMCIRQGSSERRPLSLARSEAALCEKLEELGMKEGAVVVWQVQGIAWGRWQGGSLKLAGDAAKKCSLWLELRVFNEEEELRLKKSGASGARGRRQRMRPKAIWSLKMRRESSSRFCRRSKSARNITAW